MWLLRYGSIGTDISRGTTVRYSRSYFIFILFFIICWWISESNIYFRFKIQSLNFYANELVFDHGPYTRSEIRGLMNEALAVLLFVYSLLSIYLFPLISPSILLVRTSSNIIAVVTYKRVLHGLRHQSGRRQIASAAHEQLHGTAYLSPRDINPQTPAQLLPQHYHTSRYKPPENM